MIGGDTEGSVGIGISLGFASESLEDTMALICEIGYTIIKDIVSPNPQTRFFIAKDPDGYNIQFTNV